MEKFDELGVRIEELWLTKNYDENEFPAIAAECLKDAGISGEISAWDVIEWSLNETMLPEQKDLRASFGDPPITVFNAPRFHIDVYFWLEGTTAIHQHGFCGAFQVLLGSSIHSWYDFEPRELVNTFTEIGDMKLKVCELLKVGDVQEILAGRQYIHGLFHLDQPSATIVVRTHKSPMYLPQYSYHKPFLAIDPFFEEANIIKKLQCLSVLFRSKHPETDRMVNELLERSDFQTTFLILSNVRHHLGHNSLEQMFNLATPHLRFEEYLATAKRRHGGLADILPEVFAHQEMVDEIVKRRGYVSEPELRFFLALLMNIDGKDRIFSMISARFPESDPLEKVLDWTFELAQTRVLGLNIPNALGIADFGDLDIFVLERLLRDCAEDEIRSAVKSEYPAKGTAEMDQIFEEKLANIRNSVIFRPLLAASDVAKSKSGTRSS